MKTSSQDVLITKNGLYTNDNQQENDITSVTAETADSNIKNINDPEYLSPLEKLQLKVQMDNFASNYAADKDIATSEGIDFAAYDAAYHAYLAYMTPLVANMTTYSPIVRSTFNSMVTAVQVEQKRFNTATQAQYNQQIKQAQTDIDDGQTKYKALQSEAKIMKSSVAGISDAADRAISSAGFATNAASAASQGANEASQAASSALANATNAQSDANIAVNQASSAVSKAESTASAFGKVDQKADSAVASAISAQSYASSAVSQASSAAADSKDAKQIAGAVSQSYKTLTDGSTMTIAELEGGLAVKLTKKDLDGYATETWAQNQINVTADGINGTLSSVKSTVDGQTTSINDLKSDSSSFKSQFTTVNDTLGKHTTDIGSLQVTAKGLQSTVSDKVSSDQLTQLSNQLTNKISDLSSSTSSQFTQTFKDINDLVKKGDVVNQFNIDAGGALLSTSGDSTKIVFSSPNIIFDSVNPVQIPNANIPGVLTGKTFEAGTITATTKITGVDIEAPLIHSPSGSFKLNGKTGDIIGASIHSADNSWGINKDGNIHGATINAPVLNLGDNGQLTASYSVNDPTGYFQPINGTGSLHMDHGYIQSTANIIYYNKLLSGIGGNKWGHWESSTQFIPAPDQAHPDTSNVAESTLTPAFLKLDIFNADKSSVNSRAYIDGTGLYINDGQSQSITSMLSDYELLSSGMAYLNSGIEMKKSASFTFGNLVLNGYHTIAMLDGKAINFTSATSHGSPIEVKAKTFTKLSQLSIKHDITPLSTAESSRLLNAIDVEKFRYTHDGATFKYQYGGVIDNVNSLGSKQYSMPPELLNEDGTGINLDSLTGILIKRVQDQDKMIGELSMRLTRLEMEK
ncbi:hypothetical protein [Pediococcus ethanolidurans]|uniref:hypothetical protein n=1 Tax=Pediococcus ethanolidurans TaxID=319653 RepID=UPI0020A7A9E1|nr:hypothetical protein [Pediococcus ethanolidurans]